MMQHVYHILLIVLQHVYIAYLMHDNTLLQCSHYDAICV